MHTCISAAEQADIAADTQATAFKLQPVCSFQQTEAAACLLSSRLASHYTCEVLCIHQIACKGRYASASLQRGAGDHHAVILFSRPHRRLPSQHQKLQPRCVRVHLCGAHIGGWLDLTEALQDAHVAKPAADRGMEGLDAGKPFWCHPGKLQTSVNLWQAVKVVSLTAALWACVVLSHPPGSRQHLKGMPTRWLHALNVVERRFCTAD